MIKSNDFSYPEYFIHLHYLLSIFHYPLSIILFPGCYPPPRHSFPSSSSQSFSVQGSKLHQTQGKDKLLLLFISLLIILAAMYILGFENLKLCCLPKYVQTVGASRKAAGVPLGASTSPTSTTWHRDKSQVHWSNVQFVAGLEVYSLCKFFFFPRMGPLGGWIPVSKRWIDIGADVNDRSLNITVLFGYIVIISNIYSVYWGGSP